MARFQSRPPCHVTIQKIGPKFKPWFENGTYIFQDMAKKLDHCERHSRHNVETQQFSNQTALDYLNTVLAWYSDLDCIKQQLQSQ